MLPPWANAILYYAIDTITDAGRSTQTSRIRDGDDLGRWLDDTLTALGLDGTHLVGLSYGAWLALNQGRQSPQLVASITAVDPPGAIGRPRMSFMFKMLPDSVLAKMKSERALRRLLRRLNDGREVEQPVLDLAVAGLRTFRLTQPFPKRLTDADLQSIRTPCLLLFGGVSPVNHAAAATRRALRLLPDAEAEVVPDAGHMLPVEHPEFFARRVLAFVESVDARPPGGPIA